MAEAAYGSLPFLQQIKFQLGKTTIPTQSWIDVWRDEHDAGFMVAGAAKAELLTDLQSAVSDAITEGQSLGGFKKRFLSIAEKHGWSYNGSPNWRSHVIYETNLMQSYNAGRYAQLTDPDLLSVRPYWRYHHKPGELHPRPMHLAWNNLVLPASSPWWSTHFPANGWGCQCWVTAESERSLQRKNLNVGTAPPLDYEAKIVGQQSGNPRVVRVPKGIDPGFDYAPGASRADQIREVLVSDLTRFPEPIASHLKADLLKMPPAPPPAPPAQPDPDALATTIGIEAAAAVVKSKDKQ